MNKCSSHVRNSKTQYANCEVRDVLGRGMSVLFMTVKILRNQLLYTKHCSTPSTVPGSGSKGKPSRSKSCLQIYGSENHFLDNKKHLLLLRLINYGKSLKPFKEMRDI